MKFFVVGRLDDLWKRAFKYGPITISDVRSAGRNGNKFHDEIIDTFLCEYEGAMEMQMPNGYAFKKDDKVTDPTLMQLYTSYKIKTSPYFGNFSGTGSGKTLSAVLASRIIDSKLTVIVCPNDVVGQWKDRIIEAFPDSNVILGKEAFYSNTQYNNQQHSYVVLNYDKFSQDDSPNLIINFVDQNRVDFVILDEVHFTKIRYDDREASQRRRNLDGLLTATRKKNPNIKVLGLSATPVVNNLNEGKSLLELITGKVYDDVVTRETISNAVTLYQRLSTLSIREIPEYNIEIQPHYAEVEAPRPTDSNIRHLKSNPLAIEQLLTPARIPEIIKCLKADGVSGQQQTIIYTEYVTDVIEQLSAAVRKAGYTFGLYTGLDRSGLTRFLERKVQVLIASRPISVGVDGLQHVCNKLIINTLPWTNAQYQQLVGRLYRIGQTEKTVQVYIIKASLGGYPYDALF